MMAYAIRVFFLCYKKRFGYGGGKRRNSIPIADITSVSFVVEKMVLPFHSAWHALSSSVIAFLLRKSFLSVFASVAAKYCSMPLFVGCTRVSRWNNVNFSQLSSMY